MRAPENSLGIRELLRWPWCLLVPMFVVSWYAVNGYNFGIWDHSLLLPIEERTFDSSHLEGDFLFDTAHPTLLWYVFAPFTWALGTATAYAVMHVLCLTALAVSVVILVRAIVGPERYLLVSAVALALCVPTASTFAAIPSVDAILVPRVVSLAPLLCALAFAIRGRFIAGFVITGLVFNLHPTTAAHAAVLVGALWLASKPLTLSRWLEPVTFLLAAIPLLVLVTLTGAGTQVSAPYSQEWYELVELSWPFHHALAHFGNSQWYYGGASYVFWLASRSAFRYRAADVMMVAVLVFCALGYVLLEYARLPQIIALHVFESTRFNTYIVAVLIAAWWVKACSEKSLMRAVPGLTAGAALIAYKVISTERPTSLGDEVSTEMLACLSVVAISGFLQWRIAKEPNEAASVRAPKEHIKVVMVVTAIVLAAAVARLRSTIPRQINFSVEDSLLADFRDVPPEGVTKAEFSGLSAMRWSRGNLPEDALVAIPPSFLHPLVSFRVVADRRLFVSWKDGSESAFSESFAKKWKERIEAVSGPEVLQALSERDAFVWYGRTLRAVELFNTLSKDRLLALHRDYGVTHAVRPAQSEDLDLSISYEDSAWRIYLLGEETWK